MTLFSSLVTDPRADGIFVALGVGLLIGAERERRKGEGEARGAAGIRTFAIASLGGALARMVNGEIVLAITIAAVAVLATASYLCSAKDDPGLTTEVALVLTVLLGALATVDAAMAAAIGVSVAALLAVRAPLHGFVRDALSEAEVRDALILAIATFVVWPFLPAGAFGPFGALNPHAIWLVVILVMTISALGHIAVRLIGARAGIPLAGFFSGFISSTATIGALGVRAARDPIMLNAAVAGAVLSTIATIIQMAVLLAAIDIDVARALAGSLLGAGLTAVFYAAVFVVTAVREDHAATPARERGRAFGVGAALLFGAMFALVLLTAGALEAWFGERGALTGVAVAGFVDVHAASASVATLAMDGALEPSRTAVPILAAFSTNTLTKMLLAFGSRNRPFWSRVVPGLILVAAAAWAGALIRLG